MADVFASEIGRRNFLVIDSEVSIPVERIKSFDLRGPSGHDARDFVRIYVEDDPEDFYQFVAERGESIHDFLLQNGEDTEAGIFTSNVAGREFLVIYPTVALPIDRVSKFDLNAPNGGCDNSIRIHMDDDSQDSFIFVNERADAFREFMAKNRA